MKQLENLEKRSIIIRGFMYFYKEEVMSDLRNDNYIGIEAAAEYLGVKTSTIRTWIKKKNMPSHRIGGKLLKFKRSEIDEWVNCEKKIETDEEQSK